MSRSMDRAYDITLKTGENFSVDDISQMRVVGAAAEHALVTSSNGILKLVPTSSFGGGTTEPGATLPTPPIGENDALTCDPAGVVRWGGTVSAGSF